MAFPTTPGATVSGNGNELQVTREQQVIVQETLRQHGALEAVSTSTTDVYDERFPVIAAGQIEAQPVNENEHVALDTFATTEKELTQKEFGVAVPISRRLLRAGLLNPSLFLQVDLPKSFNKAITAHLIGRSGGSNVTSQFGATGNLRQANDGSPVEAANLDQAGYRGAIAAAIQQQFDAGYTPSHVIVPSDIALHLNTAAETNEDTRLIYSAGVDPFLGLTPVMDSHLDKIGAAAGAGKIKGIVLDKSQVYVRAFHGLELEVSTDGAYEDSTGAVRAVMGRRQVLMMWTLMLGAIVANEDAVTLIVDAS